MTSAFGPFINAVVQRVNLLLWFAPALEPTSWFRTPEVNNDAGGHAQSQHLFGLAVDFTGSQDALRAANALARDFGLRPFQESTHLHVQLFPAGALERAGVTFPMVV